MSHHRDMPQVFPWMSESSENLVSWIVILAFWTGVFALIRHFRKWRARTMQAPPPNSGSVRPEVRTVRTTHVTVETQVVPPANSHAANGGARRRRR